MKADGAAPPNLDPATIAGVGYSMDIAFAPSPPYRCAVARRGG